MVPSWTCLWYCSYCSYMSSGAQASSHHAVHRRMTSTGWLRLFSTTEARTVSVQCLDVWLLKPAMLVTGKKVMVECQRRGDIVAVLPRLELSAVDVVVAHASAKSYAAQAATTGG